MYIYIYIHVRNVKRKTLVVPWILLMNRYILWQRISEKLRNTETNGSNIAVVSSPVYFLLARSGGENIG